MTGRYREFGVREGMDDPEFPLNKVWRNRELAPGILKFIGREMTSGFDNFVGVTNDGVRRDEVYDLQRTGASTDAAIAAAEGFLATLTPEQWKLAALTLEGGDQRNWFNGVEMPYGLSLRDATPAQRDAALAMIRAGLSERGYQQVWNGMQLNEILGEIVGDTVALSKWNYGVAVFGTPSPDAPWGWQIQGHHVVVTYTMIGDQVVVSPMFIGAEPGIVDHGPLKGMALVEDEERLGHAMMAALDPQQQATATIYTSMLKQDLPPERTDRVDERVQGGALKDNVVIPYEGLRADRMTADQRAQLLDLIGLYLARMPDAQAAALLSTIERFLDETWFAWIGRVGDGSPFYYKIHGPAILIEFDHHCGIVLDNDFPERFHIHTQVRLPNGGDYAHALIGQFNAA